MFMANTLSLALALSRSSVSSTLCSTSLSCGVCERMSVCFGHPYACETVFVCAIVLARLVGDHVLTRSRTLNQNAIIQTKNHINT